MYSVQKTHPAEKSLLVKEYRVVSALRAELEESLRQLAGERFDEYLRVIEAHGRITRKLAKVL